MPNVEKVIKGLECCIGYGIEDTPGCEDCPYNDMGDTCERMRPLYEDALALLKVQEPIAPVENAGFYYCGACKCAFTVHRQKYCSDCGREVKWE